MLFGLGFSRKFGWIRFGRFWSWRKWARRGPLYWSTRSSTCPTLPRLAAAATWLRPPQWSLWYHSALMWRGPPSGTNLRRIYAPPGTWPKPADSSCLPPRPGEHSGLTKSPLPGPCFDQRSTNLPWVLEYWRTAGARFGCIPASGKDFAGSEEKRPPFPLWPLWRSFWPCWLFYWHISVSYFAQNQKILLRKQQSTPNIELPK